MLPVFHCLPNKLALQYSALSPCENFRERMLRRMYPGVHEGFCDDTLFLVIEKD